MTGAAARPDHRHQCSAYEVFCRVCDVFDNRAVGHRLCHRDRPRRRPPAPAACWGSRRQQIVHAIGIYVVGGVTLNQTRVGTLSNWKACAAAEASRQAIFAVAARAGRHDRPQPGVRGARRLLRAHQPQAVRAAGARRRRRAVRHACTLHQALHARPVRPDGRPGRGRRAHVLRRHRRDRRGEHPGGAARRSRSWRTAPTSGGRRPTRPPTTACPMRPPWR